MANRISTISMAPSMDSGVVKLVFQILILLGIIAILLASSSLSGRNQSPRTSNPEQPGMLPLEQDSSFPEHASAGR